MSEFNFILQSFGLQNIKPRFYGVGKKLESKHSDFGGAKILPADGLDDNMNGGMNVMSILGTPVFSHIILANKKNDKFAFLDWVLAEVNMQKNIVKTEIQGRNGTVKEYISDGDYEVRLRGGIFGRDAYAQKIDRAYPKKELTALKELLRLPEPLSVTSEYLQLFSIYDLVVEDFKFPQQEGVQNIQLFDITCSQDIPIQLEVNA